MLLQEHHGMPSIDQGRDRRARVRRREIRDLRRRMRVHGRRAPDGGIRTLFVRPPAAAGERHVGTRHHLLGPRSLPALGLRGAEQFAAQRVVQQFVKDASRRSHVRTAIIVFFFISPTAIVEEMCFGGAKK